jgi:S-formylglutathione hydrolase
MRSPGKSVFSVVCLLIVVGCASSASTSVPSQPAATEPAVASASPAAAASPSPSASGDAQCSPTPEAIAGMTAVQCTVPAPSLANNLLGDPAELQVEILMPAGYETSGRTYPSVYVLAGLNDDASYIAYQLGSGLKAAVAPEAEAIYVLVGGINSLGGSFYVNSPVTGNWEDAIAVDLVAFVDGAYRTLPAAASRGMAGHSMGGFGALSIAMHRPDVFGAVYAMSPGLFGPNGAGERLGDEEVFAPLLELRDKLAGMPAADRGKALVREGTGSFDVAYGAAFVPDPASPIFMKLPYTSEGGKLTLDPEVWKLWEGGFGGIEDKLATYGSNLKQLRAIGIDWGIYDEYDWIPEGCRTFVDLATNAGLKVTHSAFEGDHQGSLDSRIADFAIPFFATNLVR